jgi:hypothetical protein
MIDESMHAKYTLPQKEDAGGSKRRRGANTGETADTESGDRGSGHQGGGAGGKGEGSKGGHKGAGRGGKKGGGGQKGRKGGKGRDDGWEQASVSQCLSTQAKLILRLESDRRERDRNCQWAIDFKLPYNLTDVLSNAVTIYRESKPETGRHPEGSLNDVQWSLFAQQLFIDFEKVDATSENKERLVKLRNCLKASVYTGGERGPDGGKTVCSLFRPAHRVNDDSTTWTWLFRLRMDTSRGRDVHEQLLVCSSFVEELHAHVNIRKDRTPKDGLVRQLETQLSGLRV